MKIIVLSHCLFDGLMEEMGLNDTNVEKSNFVAGVPLVDPWCPGGAGDKSECDHPG